MILVLAAAICVWLALPAMSAAVGTGRIKGAVTRAVGGAAIEGTEVCAYQAGGKTDKCTDTNAQGEYSLTNLPGGEYLLEFVGDVCHVVGADLQCTKPYATQYWLNAATPEAARPVPVLEGLPSSGFDGSLTLGGEIEGSIAESEGHTVTAPMCLYAISASSGVVEGFTETEAGHYVIEGLASGSYDIYAEESIEECTPGTGKPTTWASQYYNGVQTHFVATPVAVTAGLEPPVPATANIGLVRSSAVRPANTAAPEITGAAEVGQTLTCSPGSWRGTPAPTYAYQWLRNGSAITGATSATYSVQAADSDDGLECVVTATNEAGSERATSARIYVQFFWDVSPPASKSGTAVAAGNSISTSGLAQLSMTCSGEGACNGTLRLTAKVSVLNGKHHKRKLESVTVGEASFSMAANGHEMLDLHLSAEGKSLVAKAGEHGLSVQLSGSGVKSRTVVIKATAKKGKR